MRREVSELEAKNQVADNAATSSKFREQSLQQEVDLLKRSNEWHENELKTRTAEQTKFRKEKNARIAELQRANEDATQTVEALRRTETTLRNRLEEVNGKAEDSLQKIQHLQESAAKAEESFRAELDNARRLADLQKQSADTARSRLQEVSENLDQFKDKAAEEIGELQGELQTQHSERETAENKVAELESQVERLEGDLAAHQQPQSVPGTPRRNLNGHSNLGTPGRAGSPAAFSPGASRMKGGLSFTQLYSEHAQMKSDLQRERNSNEELRRNLDEMLQMMESKGPELEELKMDHDRLQAEVEDLSRLLDEVTVDRDAARKEARKFEGQVEGLNREAGLLRQQARDLSAQIKVLLVAVQARDQGLSSLSGTEQMQLEQAARDELDDAALEGMSDTGQLISSHLTIFKNVNELQQQNSRLLHLTRELGERMEGEEARAKQQQQAKDQQELEALRERVLRHQDELKAITTRSESYVRERDMFRRMLAHRGQLPPGSDLASAFGQSVDGSNAPGTPTQGAFGQSAVQSSNAKDLGDYAKLLKELQSHFDTYRQEAATDHEALRQQVNQLGKEKSELQGEVARSNSQVTLGHERYDLLKSNFDMLKAENGELQKRSQSLSEIAAKQDLRTQQVAEELVEAKALAESMRNETANLKAERQLWKKIESRLNEDNQSLMDERSRLNRMITDLQNLQNERELSDSETRRRLQGRVESLEAELATAKRKLDDEVEEGRKAALRREYESEQNRTRIDDLMKSLSNAREELVAAKTQRDQLQARVDEMKIELRSAEERASALQPRPTTRPAPDGTKDATDEGTTTLTREQDLQLEVTQLKRDLDLGKAELEQARAHVEQYKAISQSSEEELQSLNETNDQYREDTDRLINEKDTKIQDLEKRVEEISEELSSTNRELTGLRTQQDEEASKLNEQKAIYDSEIARLKDECERYLETSKLHQEDLKAQAQIAQQAQQSYEDELVKHAEAAKNLQQVRTQFNELKTEVAQIRAEAEAAKTSLAQNEESWAETRSQYERELTELRTRRDDVNAQNKVLHDQLDSVSSQIASLKQNRAIPAEEGSPAPPSSGMENLQEVIRYLRREKEIVDVQYELSIQESKRLKQQLDHTQSQLEQTREKLNQERQSQSDREQSALSHNKLMQTINELNLFRESNASLRNEARQAQTQLAEKVQRVEELMSQLEPAQARIRELESDLETKDGSTLR